MNAKTSTAAAGPARRPLPGPAASVAGPRSDGCRAERLPERPRRRGVWFL